MVNLGLINGTPMKEVSDLLENLDATTNSAVLTEKLADLYAAQGKPESAKEFYRRALKLNPSPQQKNRIELVARVQKFPAQARRANRKFAHGRFF